MGSLEYAFKIRCQIFLFVADEAEHIWLYYANRKTKSDTFAKSWWASNISPFSIHWYAYYSYLEATPLYSKAKIIIHIA